MVIGYAYSMSMIIMFLKKNAKMGCDEIVFQPIFGFRHYSVAFYFLNSGRRRLI